jgi:hypothetical protein
MIRDSDGTRTGQLFSINLPVVSWWIGLVGFLGYGAYYLAIEYSIQREVKSEVVKWMGFVQEGQLTRAFHRTLEPGRRAGINPDDTAKINAEFREPLLAFANSDLVRLMQRNDPAKSQFQPGGLREWAYKENGIECTYAGTYLCPEGRFPIRIPLKGYESTTGTSAEGVGRQWQVSMQPGGFIQRDESTFTDYGWMMMSLEAHGSRRGLDFVNAIGLAPFVRPYVFHDFILRNDINMPATKEMNLMAGRISVAGGPVLAQPYTLEYQKALATFARLPNGNELPAEKQTKFMTAWNEGRGLVPSGGVIRGAEILPTVTITPTAVQVRLPIEIPDANMTASRGRLVVECTDPQVLAELKRLYERADPNLGTKIPPEDIRTRSYDWRIIRIETDMVIIKPPEDLAPPGTGPSRSKQ